VGEACAALGRGRARQTTRGGKKKIGRWLGFKGSGREGGAGVDAAWRQGGRERGGPGRRRGSGPAAVHALRVAA
jgi:hypothetical protein